MIRNLNFTGRLRIERSDVAIRRRDALDEDPEIEVQLHLSEYGFASTARVYLEAHASVGTSNTAWGRFDIDSPFDSMATQIITLEGFADVPSVTFNVRAVAPETNRLLGLAEGVPWTNLVDDVADVEGLLPVERQDIGELAWKLDFDLLGNPVLLISSRLWRYRGELLTSQHFRSMVLPEVLRDVLSAALDQDSGFDANAPEDHWFGDWVAWMREIRELRPHVRVLHAVFDASESDAKALMIDEVVSDFARSSKCRFATRLERCLDEEYRE